MRSELSGDLPSELAQIVESVFAAMLNLEVDGDGTPWSPGEDG